MTDRHDVLMDRIATSIEQYRAGRERAARRILLRATVDPAEQCGMATALATAIVHALAPDVQVLRTNVVVEDDANPSPADQDRLSLAAAVIAAVGNDDLDGAAHAWIAAGPRTQNGALWTLLRIASDAVEPAR